MPRTWDFWPGDSTGVSEPGRPPPQGPPELPCPSVPLLRRTGENPLSVTGPPEHSDRVGGLAHRANFSLLLCASLGHSRTSGPATPRRKGDCITAPCKHSETKPLFVKPRAALSHNRVVLSFSLSLSPQLGDFQQVTLSLSFWG